MDNLDCLTIDDVERLLDAAPAHSVLPIDVEFARRMILDTIEGTDLDLQLGGTQSSDHQVIPDAQTAALLLVPSADWLRPVRAALRHLLNNRTADDTGDHTDDPWMVPESPGPLSWDTAGAAVTDAWHQGRSVVGVAFSADDLPLEFWCLPRRGQARLPGPTNLQVMQFIDDRTGQWPNFPYELLPDPFASQVVPSDLALGWYDGITADDWLAAVRKSLATRTSFQRRMQAATEAPPAPEVQGLPAGPTLDQLAGMDEAVAWGRQLAEDLADYRAGRIGWDAVEHGVVLAGPPGTGKTTFAAALARSCGVPLILGSHASWQAAGHQGEMLKAMNATFAEAAEASPCILFIDEIDGFTSRTASSHGYNSTYQRQIVNALLEHLDGVEGRQGVVVVGATNMPEVVEPALLRPGRLERVITIPVPDTAALIGIFRHHLGTDLPGADLFQVAAIAATGGATGAHVTQWVRGARRVARKARRSMRLGDLMQQLASLDPAADGTAIAVLVPIGGMQ
ncbi:AAA family ATPase [Nitrospirillum pindoramense]|uniref:ATPase family protein associated with various cellular activities (AAA) n=1 Tax=Nitrospirillum amazonense TaxID=28077 RepID=A0A560H4G3_9PROT|nr:AAA family ATPase [Nitrospirillum amazonense]TWB41196.1 ATPase family protein associated with various cellular activities (AAA) [Nitrospirillum amazonense]